MASSVVSVQDWLDAWKNAAVAISWIVEGIASISFSGTLEATSTETFIHVKGISPKDLGFVNLARPGITVMLHGRALVVLLESGVIRVEPRP